MASIKAIEFENELLAASAVIKELINRDFSAEEDLDKKQDYLIKVNRLWDIGHKGARKLRKACAFHHRRIEVLEDFIRSKGLEVPIAEKVDYNV